MLVVDAGIEVVDRLGVAARDTAHHVIVGLAHARVGLRRGYLPFAALRCGPALHRPSLWSPWVGCVRVWSPPWRGSKSRWVSLRSRCFGSLAPEPEFVP